MWLWCINNINKSTLMHLATSGACRAPLSRNWIISTSWRRNASFGAIFIVDSLQIGASFKYLVNAEFITTDHSYFALNQFHY